MPRTVSLASDFNGWDETKNEMHESDAGTWSCWIPKLSSGTYRYKFVIDGSVWTEDPANPDKEPDGFGGWNSRFVVSEF